MCFGGKTVVVGTSLDSEVGVLSDETAEGISSKRDLFTFRGFSISWTSYVDLI